MASVSSSFSLFSSPCFLRQKLRSDNARVSSPPLSSVKFRSPRVAATYTSAETGSPCIYSSKITSPASLYEVLGVPKSATYQEIKAAYRRLARVCHPDAVAATDQKEPSAVEFIKIHAAYSTLADPQKRADYDRELFSRQPIHRSPTPASAYAATAASYRSYMSGFGGNTRRNWETDQCWCESECLMECGISIELAIKEFMKQGKDS